VGAADGARGGGCHWAAQMLVRCHQL
jgi:hypothetical protein